MNSECFKISRLSAQLKVCRSEMTKLSDRAIQAEKTHDLFRLKTNALLKKIGVSPSEIESSEIDTSQLDVLKDRDTLIQTLKQDLSRKDKELMRLLRERGISSNIEYQDFENDGENQLDSEDDSDDSSESSHLQILESFHQEREKEFLISTENMKRSLKSYDCDILHKEVYPK